MNATITLTIRGELPDAIQIGDKLTLNGTVTVHTITGELIDVTSHGGNPEYIPTTAEVGVYSNSIKLNRYTTQP